MQIQISTNCVQPFRRRRTQNKKRKFRCVFLYFCSCFTTCVCIATFYLLLKWRPLLFWFVALQEEWKGHGELCHKQRENKILTSLFFRQRISTRLNVFFQTVLWRREIWKMFWIVSCYNAFFWNVVGYSTKNNCLKNFSFPNFGIIVPKISFYGNKILARIQFPALFVYLPICNLPHFLTKLGQSEFPGFFVADVPKALSYQCPKSQYKHW